MNEKIGPRASVPSRVVPDGKIELELDSQCNSSEKTDDPFIDSIHDQETGGQRQKIGAAIQGEKEIAQIHHDAKEAGKKELDGVINAPTKPEEKEEPRTLLQIFLVLLAGMPALAIILFAGMRQFTINAARYDKALAALLADDPYQAYLHTLTVLASATIGVALIFFLLKDKKSEIRIAKILMTVGIIGTIFSMATNSINTSKKAEENDSSEYEGEVLVNSETVARPPARKDWEVFFEDTAPRFLNFSNALTEISFSAVVKMLMIWGLFAGRAHYGRVNSPAAKKLRKGIKKATNLYASSCEKIGMYEHNLALMDADKVAFRAQARPILKLRRAELAEIENAQLEKDQAFQKKKERLAKEAEAARQKAAAAEQALRETENSEEAELQDVIAGRIVRVVKSFKIPRRITAAKVVGFSAIVILLFLLSSCSDPRRETSGTSQEPQNIVIFVSSEIVSEEHRKEVYGSLTSLIFDKLPIGSSLAIYDGTSLDPVAQFKIPNHQIYENNIQFRKEELGKELKKLSTWLLKNPVGKEAPYALDVPEIFRIAGTMALNKDDQVLIIGSAQYVMSKNKNWSMVNEVGSSVPSDSAVSTPPIKERGGVYSLVGREDSVKASIHWVYLEDPFQHDLHRRALIRFWSGYFQYGGATFRSSEIALANVLPRLTQETPYTDVIPCTDWDHDSKLEMIHFLERERVTLPPEETEETEELEDSGEPEEIAPTIVETGPYAFLRTTDLASTPVASDSVLIKRVGVIWVASPGTDLDAFAGHGNHKTLFYQNPSNEDGSYFLKDHRSPPGAGSAEVIDFGSNPPKLSDLHFAVNNYEAPQGSDPIPVTVRIETTTGDVYSYSFTLPASSGNFGKDRDAPPSSRSEKFWKILNPSEICRHPTQSRNDQPQR